MCLFLRYLWGIGRKGKCSIKLLWHGVDFRRLIPVGTTVMALSGLRRGYERIDRLIGDLREAFPDAVVVILDVHGTRPSDRDLASMVLLPHPDALTAIR